MQTFRSAPSNTQLEGPGIAPDLFSHRLALGPPGSDREMTLILGIIFRSERLLDAWLCMNGIHW